MVYINTGRFLMALLVAILMWAEFGVGLAEGGAEDGPTADVKAAHLASRGDPSSARATGSGPEIIISRARFRPPAPSPVPSPTATPAPSPTAVAPSDLLLKYLGTHRITAYSDSPRNGTDGRGITRSGERTRWGVVAVDPEVIPLRSKLMIEGMGDTVFTALDTGGGIVGKWVDIWFQTDYEALQYGVQDRSVYLVVE